MKTFLIKNCELRKPRADEHIEPGFMVIEHEREGFKLMIGTHELEPGIVGFDIALVLVPRREKKKQTP